MAGASRSDDAPGSPPEVPVRTASVRVGGPEAIRAVDRAVHARLERHLRLAAAGSADHGEVLASGTVVAPLIAARATDAAHVVPTLAGGSATGAAAGAALRLAGEPLLHVVLLIGGRVDEVHPAVDAVQGPIDVGHFGSTPGTPWARHGLDARTAGQPYRRTG